MNTEIHAVIDNGQLLIPGDEQAMAYRAKLETEAKAAGYDGDVGRWMHRLRVGGDGPFVTFAKKSSAEPGSYVLAAGPLSQVVKKLVHESDVDTDIVRDLESRLAFGRAVKEQAMATDRKMTAMRDEQAQREKWFKRPRMSRALLTLATRTTEYAGLMRAIVRALEAEPEQPARDASGLITSTVPDGADKF